MDYLDNLNTGTWLALTYCACLVIILIAYFWFVIRRGKQNAKDEAENCHTFDGVPTPEVFYYRYKEYYYDWKKKGGNVQIRKL